MANVRLGNGCLWMEILIRLVFLIVFVKLQAMEAFIRYITADDMNTIYKHPRHDSYVPSYIMWPVVLFAAPLYFIVNYFFKRDLLDLGQSILAVTLSLGLTGIITDLLKILAGRPRPDFYWRCFPNGDLVQDSNFICNGIPDDIIEGRKSFPSGHSSLSFCSLGVLSLWMMGQLGVWSHRGGRTAPSSRLTFSLSPLVAATAIAISRTCDYHHHWEDVAAGSLLGFVIAYISYRQYYPPLTSINSHRSLVSNTRTAGLQAFHRRSSQDSLLPEGTIQGDYGTADTYTSRWERSPLTKSTDSPVVGSGPVKTETKWI